MCVCWWIEDFEGMSDLCFYELEDSVWDEFGKGDDHKVPDDEFRDQFEFPGDSRKKPRHEVIGPTPTNDTTNFDFQGKSRNNKLLINEKDMSKKGLLSLSSDPDDTFPASRNNQQVKEVTSMSSDGQGYKSSNIDTDNNGFCADDSILDDKCTDLDTNLYRLPLNDLSQADNDLSFLDNDCEGKNSSELLYYNLPEIGNFEDIDRMFRSSDSTFGLSNLSNEDDMNWFSASHSSEGFEDPLKSSAKFINVSNHCEDLQPSGDCSSSNGSNPKNAILDKQISSQTLDSEGGSVSHISFTNREMKPNIEDNACPNTQPIRHNKSVGKREDPHQHNSSVSLHQQGDPKKVVNVKPPFRNSPQFYSYQSASPKESSYASNQMDMSSSPSFYKNKEFPHLSARNSSVQCDSTKAQKKVALFEHDLKDHNVVGGNEVFPTELDSSNAQGSSCLGSVLDDISLEATSFRQLQHVMEKLDLKTKLYIRDSLYRLAKSVEQRHSYANPNGNLAGEETNNVLSDIETNTNPIDRSIARLLFHRPSDRAAVNRKELSPLTSHVMNNESVTDETTEKKPFQEETTGK